MPAADLDSRPNRAVTPAPSRSRSTTPAAGNWAWFRRKKFPSANSSATLRSSAMPAAPRPPAVGREARRTRSPTMTRTIRVCQRSGSPTGRSPAARSRRTAGTRSDRSSFRKYTLSHGVMKLTAQMPPLGALDSQVVRLQVRKASKWSTVGEARIHAEARTATFRVARWDDRKDVPYRLAYSLQFTNGRSEERFWTGTVRRARWTSRSWTCRIRHTCDDDCRRRTHDSGRGSHRTPRVASDARPPSRGVKEQLTRSALLNSRTCRRAYTLRSMNQEKFASCIRQTLTAFLPVLARRFPPRSSRAASAAGETEDGDVLRPHLRHQFRGQRACVGHPQPARPSTTNTSVTTSEHGRDAAQPSFQSSIHATTSTLTRKGRRDHS